MANAEVLLVDWLNANPSTARLNIEAFLDVPEDRPERFITVERTGGPGDWIRDSPLLAVQVWALHRYEAGDLAEAVAKALREAVALPNVARVRVNSLYNFPDPESRQPRYQIVLELVTKND